MRWRYHRSRQRSPAQCPQMPNLEQQRHQLHLKLVHYLRMIFVISASRTGETREIRWRRHHSKQRSPAQCPQMPSRAGCKLAKPQAAARSARRVRRCRIQAFLPLKESAVAVPRLPSAVTALAPMDRFFTQLLHHLRTRRASDGSRRRPRRVPSRSDQTRTNEMVSEGWEARA